MNCKVWYSICQTMSDYDMRGGKLMNCFPRQAGEPRDAELSCSHRSVSTCQSRTRNAACGTYLPRDRPACVAIPAENDRTLITPTASLISVMRPSQRASEKSQQLRRRHRPVAAGCAFERLRCPVMACAGDHDQARKKSR